MLVQVDFESDTSADRCTAAIIVIYVHMTLTCPYIKICHFGRAKRLSFSKVWFSHEVLTFSTSFNTGYLKINDSTPFLETTSEKRETLKSCRCYARGCLWRRSWSLGLGGDLYWDVKGALLARTHQSITTVPIPQAVNGNCSPNC